MTVPIRSAAGQPADHLVEPAQQPDSRFRRWLGRWRFWLIIGGIFLLVCALALSKTLGGSAGSNLDLAADNPAPNGAMASAQVLGQQGVGVVRTDDLSSTVREISRTGATQTTVLVYDAKNFLNTEQAAALSATGARLVVVSPGPLVLAAFNSDIRSAGTFNPGQDQKPAVEAKCENADAIAAARVDPGFSRLYSGTDDSGTEDSGANDSGTNVCFSAENQTAPTAVRSGILAQSSDGRFTAIGSSTVFSNGSLANQGNAALAVRLLGHDRNLLWYLPSAKDIVSDRNQPSLSDLQPDWLAPLSIWLLVVGILAVLWKARRDGPLVEEPLPVSVKAAETALGRARLYQDARAFERAAGNLRSATLNRLAQKYRLGPQATSEAVVLAILTHSALAESEVRRILSRTVPTSESRFLVWSQELAALERELDELEREH